MENLPHHIMCVFYFLISYIWYHEKEIVIKSLTSSNLTSKSYMLVYMMNLKIKRFPNLLFFIYGKKITSDSALFLGVKRGMVLG